LATSRSRKEYAFLPILVIDSPKHPAETRGARNNSVYLEIGPWVILNRVFIEPVRGSVNCCK
jgi:hypothetical protein